MTRFTVKQTILGSAVAAAFGLAATPALAVVALNAGTGAIKVASEIPSTTAALANAGNALDMSLTAPTGVVPSTTDPVYIRFSLSGNAKFSGTPTIVCSAFSAAGAGANTAVNPVIQAGGNGFTFVTFTIANSAATTGSFLSGSCTAAGFTGINIASGGLVSYTVTARTEYKDGASYTTAYLSDKSIITFTKGVDGAASAASALVVDATSGSDNFASAQNHITTATLAVAGKYIASAVGTSAATATLAANASADDIFSGVTVTVSGASLAAALAANGTSGVFLSSASSCATVNYTVQSTANAGTTVTFTGITTAHIGDTGVYVCLNVSGGTTQIATGVIYVGSLGTFATAVTTNLAGMEQLITVTSNGTTKNAYIVHSPSSTAKASQLWVKNTGATAGAVFATCYNSAGTIVGTANSTLISSLAVNELAKKTASEVFTAIGYTTGYTATEKFSCVLNGALSGMELVNQTQDTATGAITVTQAQTN